MEVESGRVGDMVNEFKRHKIDKNDKIEPAWYKLINEIQLDNEVEFTPGSRVYTKGFHEVKPKRWSTR